MTLNNIGECHLDLHNYDDVLPHQNQALQLKQNFEFLDLGCDLSITQCNIGRCLIK